MTTTPSVAVDVEHAHLQMASGAFRKVFDLLRGPKASEADPAGFTQSVTFTNDLTWIVDSLNVQHVLLQMLPASQRDSDQSVQTLGSILRCAFNLERVDANANFDGGHDKAEGDVLENVLNALGASRPRAKSCIGRMEGLGSRARLCWSRRWVCGFSPPAFLGGSP